MNKSNSLNAEIEELQARVSELEFELDRKSRQLEDEQSKRNFYQLIADFTLDWELWLNPNGSIKYCSPSCFDLTGFTSNQIMASSSISTLLVYQPDQQKFDDFIKKSLDQMIVNNSIDFRILTRSKQLRWCNINVRGVYNKLGRYLGIRISIHDITKLKSALGHIHQLEVGREFEQMSKSRLKDEIEFKERELISFLLQLSQKNNLLLYTINALKKLHTTKNSREINQLIDKLSESTSFQLDWNVIEDEVNKLHPNFIAKLTAHNEGLTAKEKKLAVYVHLGLTSKEIAGLQSITVESVEIARVRLRKKLNIQGGQRLSKYLSSL